jgi:hypothetical protein
MRRRRQVISAVALVILAVAGYLGYLFGTGAGVIGNADRSQHVAGNEALLRQVPVSPGARYLTAYTTESKDNNGCPEGLGPITSYSTTHVYALEAALSRSAVIQWYRSRFAARCRFSGGSGHGDGRYFDASFHCGNGSIFIAPTEDSLLISADYNGYGRYRCPSADPGQTARGA